MKTHTIVLAIILSLTYANAQTNIMAYFNGDFENGLTNWRLFEVPNSLGSTAEITSDAICGTHAVKITFKGPTLNDYWNGNAVWQLYYNQPIADWSGAAGTSIQVVNGIWYWFQRYQVSGLDALGVQCFKSTDSGQTWSTPVHIVEPTVGTPWSKYATDGDAYYDASANKWRYLFQSLTTTAGAGWTCSYLERQGADPMGLFTTPVGFTNPAINNKEIWSQINNNTTNNCYKITGAENAIYDEGTPNIISKSGNVFTVTFHGAANIGNPVAIYGFRGIATTTDFQTYTPAAPDCILSSYDSNKWNVSWLGDLNGKSGSVGVGAATSMQEGNYWYTLIEGCDISLSPPPATTVQNWTFGLFRSTSLSSTTCENWTSNPVFTPTQQILEWQYARLFKDGSITYLAIDKANPAAERAFKIYKLIWK